MFNNLGITHQKSYAYSSQQNNIAERKHRHILEVIRAIRFQTRIPITFWGYYVLVVTYLINRMPSTIIGNQSPYERLYCKKPSLNHLRIPGYLSYSMTIQEYDKLMSRSRIAIHIGYAATQKGYILYDISSKPFLSKKIFFPSKPSSKTLHRQFLLHLTFINSQLNQETNL